MNIVGPSTWVLKKIGVVGLFFMIVVLPPMLTYWITGGWGAVPVEHNDRVARVVGSAVLYVGMFFVCAMQHGETVRRQQLRTARAKALELVRALLIVARADQKNGEPGQAWVTDEELDTIERGLGEPPT